MIKNFAGQETAALFFGRSSRRIPGDAQRRALAKLLALHAATSLDELRKIPGNRLELGIGAPLFASDTPHRTSETIAVINQLRHHSLTLNTEATGLHRVLPIVGAPGANTVGPGERDPLGPPHPRDTGVPHAGGPPSLGPPRRRL